MTASGASATPVRRARPPAGPAALLFKALLVVWLVMPVLLVNALGQDAVPYLVAGDLAREEPDEVYASQNGDLFDLRPVFAQRWCQLAATGTDCEEFNVAFVSPPQALPFSIALSALGGRFGVLVMRLLAAACLAGGMWLIWQRLHRVSSRAPTLLAATALLLTPFVMVPLTLAQTSPVLFLAVVVGVSGTERTKRAAAVSGAWVAAIVFKLFPIVVAPVLLAQRRWKLLAWTAGWLVALTVIAALVVPFSSYGDFLRTSVLLGERSAANPYNGSIEVLQWTVSPSLVEGVPARALLGVRFLVGAALWWWAARKQEDDVGWAYAWLVSLLIVPFLWWHYLWVVIGVAAWIIGTRADADRWLPALPVTALVFLPFAVVNARGSSWPVPQALLLIVAVGAATWLLRQPARTSSDRERAQVSD